MDTTMDGTVDTSDTSTSIPMSVTQAAARAGVSTKTVRRWLTSGRLAATHGLDGAWLIDQADLERAIATPGPSTDIPTLHTGHVQSMSIVQELLDRLERQAGEITALRLERNHLAGQVLALQAPRADSPDIALRVDSERPPLEPTQTPARNARSWWLRWLGA